MEMMQNNTCTFCKSKAIREDPPFQLCQNCYDAREESKGGDLSKLTKYDPSKLCVQCGICCFMLSARITKAEADQFCEEWGMPFDNFAQIASYGPNEGELTIKMPCKMLHGKPLQYSVCRAHKGYRPNVCHTYLCKIAMRYKAGLMGIHEALFWLRAAWLTKDLSIFNWTQEGDEGKIIMAAALGEMATNLHQMGFGRADANLILARLITPSYHIKSDDHQFMISALLNTYDRGDNDPILFVDKDLVDQWAKPKRLFAEFIIGRVLKCVRRCFIKEEPVSPIMQAIEEISKQHQSNTPKLCGYCSHWRGTLCKANQSPHFKSRRPSDDPACPCYR